MASRGGGDGTGIVFYYSYSHITFITEDELDADEDFWGLTPDGRVYS